jgi:hypothetical protein
MWNPHFNFTLYVNVVFWLVDKRGICLPMLSFFRASSIVDWNQETFQYLCKAIPTGRHFFLLYRWVKEEIRVIRYYIREHVMDTYNKVYHIIYLTVSCCFCGYTNLLKLLQNYSRKEEIRVIRYYIRDVINSLKKGFPSSEVFVKYHAMRCYCIMFHFYIGALPVFTFDKKKCSIS